MKLSLLFFLIATALHAANVTNFVVAQPIINGETISVTPSGSGGGGGDDLTGISVRYVADNVTGPGGSSVSSWPDSSGNGYNLSQPSGSIQPTLQTANVNGHSAVQFNGSGDYMTASVPATAIGGAQDTAIFIVMKQNSSQSQNGAFKFLNGSDASDILAAYSGVLYFDWQNTTAGDGRVSGAQPSGWADAWHILEVHRHSTTQQILVDGTTIVSGSATSSVSQTGTGTLYIGFATVYLSGYIAEVRIYNVNKDSTSSANIRAALKTTYGTP